MSLSLSTFGLDFLLSSADVRSEAAISYTCLLPCCTDGSRSMTSLQGERLPLVVGMCTQQLGQTSRSTDPPRGSSTEQERNMIRFPLQEFRNLIWGRLKLFLRKSFLRYFCSFEFLVLVGIKLE